MAVKKNATEAAEGKENTKAANTTGEAEKATDGAQMKPQTANEAAAGQEKDPDTVKVIYIGPSLPKAMLKSNKIFEGTPEEIKKELAAVLEKFPLVERLIVPTKELATAKDKVRTAGNILNKYYSDIASAASAEIEKEG